jgi:hypothetical protein
MPYFEFLDFGRIMAIGQCRAFSLKIVILEIFTIIMKFLNDRVPSCPILEIWDFGRIRPLGQVTMDFELITILELRSFK